jgi:ankyrin repeat protein
VLAPLHSAACYGNEAIVWPLLQKGANFNVENSETQTPLKIAVERGNKAVAQLLGEHGGIE